MLQVRVNGLADVFLPFLFLSSLSCARCAGGIIAVCNFWQQCVDRLWVLNSLSSPWQGQQMRAASQLGWFFSELLHAGDRHRVLFTG